MKINGTRLSKIRFLVLSTLTKEKTNLPIKSDIVSTIAKTEMYRENEDFRLCF